MIVPMQNHALKLQNLSYHKQLPLSIVLYVGNIIRCARTGLMARAMRPVLSAA